MNRLFRYLMIPAMVLLLAACQNSTADSGSPNKEAAEEEKLSVNEVIQKTQEASQQAKGQTLQVEGKQDFNLEAEGQSQGITQSFDMNMELTKDPAAVHLTGTMKSAGETGEMEAYQVGDEFYQSMDGGTTWLKSEGADLNQFGGDQAQNPSKALQKLEELVSKFQGDKNDMFNMKETEDQYVITLNVDKDLKQVKDLYMKQLKGSAVPALKQAGLPVKEDEVKLNTIKQVVYIDKKSFEQEKVDQKTEIEIPLDDGTTSGMITAKQEMTITLKGEYKGTIEVPQEVKDNAQTAPSPEQ